MSRDARLSILTAHEVDELYRLPRFTESDRGVSSAASPPTWRSLDGSVANLFRKSEDGSNPSGADHVRVQVASF
jgi:hypothetical protein